MGDFFIDIILRRIIIGVFGYYTLLALYKLTGNKEKQLWLDSTISDEGEAFGKGCLISLVGLVVFCLLGWSIFFLADYLGQ